MESLKLNLLSRLLCAVLCSGLVFTGCYDDGAVWRQLVELESRVQELERLCSQANTNIEALQTIVSALQEKDYVTGVAPIKEGDKVLGYSITFSKSDAVTIYHGKDGQNGNDGYVPALGVKQEGEDWYWTVDGQWLTDADGNKVRASAIDGKDGEPGAPGQSGVTPMLKIVDGYWYVSYDGGKTWESDSLGQATGDKGDSMFGEVTYDADYVYITLADGQQLTLPRTSVSSDEGAVGPATVTLDKVNVSTATFNGHLDVLASELPFSQVAVYYSDAETFNINDAYKVYTTTFYADQNFSITLPSLKYVTQYNYCIYVKVKSDEYYSEVKTFTTPMVSVDLTVTESTIVSANPIANFTGSVSGLAEEDKEDGSFLGVFYSKNAEDLEYIQDPYFYLHFDNNVSFPEIGSDGTFTVSSNPLDTDSKYYYLYFIFSAGELVSAGEVKEFQTVHSYNAPSDLNFSLATDLSSSASANCYIVSNAGLYKFKTVKGNSSESVGSVASALILWETFGTSETPECCDLIKAFCYKDGYLAFQTADTFKEGNAVIAAKDAEGNILWSWHIWMTDQPEGQVYYNNAGTMMDRNLGATSATPGDVGALGLLYQWGRKDPFLGSSLIYSDSMAEAAKSTITWPSAVSSDSSTGTIAYATAHPTTFIVVNNSNIDGWYYNDDWYYNGSSSTDNTRWATSESTKSIYDPCPAGWRVPDGGENGVWSKALGSSSQFDYTYDSTNKGMTFSGKFGADQTIWYPASGYRYGIDGCLYNDGYSGNYWSASPFSNSAYYLDFGYYGYGHPSWYSYGRADGLSVRCLQVID